MRISIQAYYAPAALNGNLVSVDHLSGACRTG
jgi:hypothetical protein